MVSLDLNRIRFASNQMQPNPVEFSPSAGENRQAWASPQGPSVRSSAAPASQSATTTDPFANLFTGTSSFQNPFAMGESDLSDTQRISAMAAMYGMQQPALPFTSMTAPVEAQAAQGIGAVSGGSAPFGPEALAKSLSVTGHQPAEGQGVQGAQGTGQQLTKPEAATNSGGGQQQNANAQGAQEASSSQEAQGSQGTNRSNGANGPKNKQEQDEIDRLIQEAETLIKQAENETDPNAKYDLASQASQKLTEAQNKVSSMQKPSPPSQGNGANHGEQNRQQNRQQAASTHLPSGTTANTSAASSPNSQSGTNSTAAVSAPSKAPPKPATGDSPVLQQILALKQSVDSIRKDAMAELTPNSMVGVATQGKSAAGTNPADPTNDANPAKRLQPVADISV
jgi:hypothetical protein